MPRSSGARPKKAVREEVDYLREKLGECRGEDWQRANAIFQEICRLCEHKGAKGGHGSPYPRACKFCNRYGHSTQFCKRKKEADARREEEEMARILAEDEAMRPKCDGVPADPIWVARLQWLRAHYDAAVGAGLEGCVEEWDMGGPCSLNGLLPGRQCAGCEEWNAWMRARDAAVPWDGGDAPKA